MDGWRAQEIGRPADRREKKTGDRESRWMEINCPQVRNLQALQRPVGQNKPDSDRVGAETGNLSKISW